MLNNMGGLTAEAIHNMLRYTSGRKSLDQLQTFLEQLQTESKIEHVEGIWRLV